MFFALPKRTCWMFFIGCCSVVHSETSDSSQNLTTIDLSLESTSDFPKTTMPSSASFESIMSTNFPTDTTLKPATSKDVVFVLDRSGSIAQHGFYEAVDFVYNVIVWLSIGNSSNDLFISVLTFASTTTEEFDLNDYISKGDLLTAVMGIKSKSTGGSTSTDDALEFAYNTSFTTSHGSRIGVPKAVVVLTDGRSNNPAQTQAQAEILHNAGIEVFSIGVGGSTSSSELNAIASDPDSYYVNTVGNFDELCQLIPVLVPKLDADVLSSVKDECAYLNATTNLTTAGSTSSVSPELTSIPPTISEETSTLRTTAESSTSTDHTSNTTPRSTSSVNFLMNSTINSTSAKDVVFVLDRSGSIRQEDFYDAVDFLYNVILWLSIGNSSNELLISVLTFASETVEEFDLDDYTSKNELLAAVNGVKSRSTNGGTNTHLALQYCFQTSFTRSHGSRNGVPKAVVVLTDGQSNNPILTQTQAADIYKNYFFADRKNKMGAIAGYSLTLDAM